MSVFRTAALFILFSASGLFADDRAGSMTVLPPPPSQMDWHNGNRTWNLDGARHIHFPMPSHGDEDHRRGRHRFRSFTPLYLGYPFGAVPRYGFPGYGYSGYYDYGGSVYYGRGYRYRTTTGLDYAASVIDSAYGLAATLNAHRNVQAAAQARPAPVRRASLPRAVARAQRAEQQGDARFRDKKYRSAYDAYRSARRAAPERPQVHFRIAQALVALGRYESAVTAMQRGMRLDPAWSESNFDLEEFYAGDEGALLNHVERLALALRDNMDNPDLLFLVGYHLYFTGHRERAMPFFGRAEQLVGDASHIVPFLEAPLAVPRQRDPDQAGEELEPAPPDIQIPRNGTRQEI